MPASPNANVISPTWTPPTMNNGTVYQWKVIPKNVAGSAIGCPTWSFTTIFIIPLAATNPTPADLAADILINTSLSWSPVTYADSYDVYFGTTLPSTPNANVTSPTWTPPVMNNFTVYQWMVVPKNTAGSAINCPTWSFTTIVPLPLAAINPIPADLATGVALTAALSWDAVTYADSYDVYFGTTLPTTPNANVTSPTWTPPVMNNFTVYHWMVIPKNVAGSAINCPTWPFTTIVPLPVAATTPSPADLAVNVLINASLSWSAVTYADSYDVYFGTTLPLTPNANVTSPTWTPPVMNNSTIYQWMIVPKNVVGSAINCPTWSFTTIVPLPLAAINPTPADLATGVALTAALSWDVVSGADSYDVYFGTTLPLTPNANVTSPTWTPPSMAQDTNYIWKIVPKNVAGNAINCPTWTFRTIILSLPAPTNLTIHRSGINKALNWDAVIGADAYNVYYALISNPLPTGWILLNTVTLNNYIDSSPSVQEKFYKVTAITLVK
jgi:hypothetical protein